MKKFVLLLLVFLLLIGLTTEALASPDRQGLPRRNIMKTYTGYFADYVGVYQTDGGTDDYAYGYVGNKDNGAGYYLLYKFKSDFPYDGTMLDDYQVRSNKVVSAVVKVVETNKGDRGSKPLTMKVSPIYGTWNGSAKFKSIPTWNANVVNTYAGFGSIPSKSNYNDRDGYHSATYGIKAYSGDSSSGPWTYVRTASISKIEYDMALERQGTSWVFQSNGTWWKNTLTSTSAYYDYYYKFHNVNITDVIKDAIDNNATGLIFWFDLGSALDNRKVLTTTLETATAQLPKITINFSDTALVPPITIAPTKGAISKQVQKIWIAPTKGPINKEVLGMMIAPTKGPINKRIF